MLSAKSLPIVTIVAACLYWIVDSLFDVYLFNSNLSFSKSFFTSDSNELWMRLSVVVILILFYLYAKTSEQTHHKLKKEIQDKNDLADEMEFLETIDPLTLLMNKRKLYELLEYEMEKDKRYKSGLSVIFCSIDNFKHIDEAYSQSIIDRLLCNIALQLTETLRASDIVSRWSENEFLILIPNKTAEEAKIVAEKIRSAIENYEFPEVENITTSIGITQYIDNDNKVTIVSRAEQALQSAQEKGMNCVEVVA